MRTARPIVAQARAWRALAFAIAAPCLIASCGEEGETPNCPPLELYDITDPEQSQRPDVVAAREAAAEAGCVTPPGTATSSPPPQGGSGGTGGTSTGNAGAGGG
jgi:hypothetical protein